MERVNVYAVRDDKNGYPQFLIYENGEWKYVSAKHFRGQIEKGEYIIMDKNQIYETAFETIKESTEWGIEEEGENLWTLGRRCGYICR